MNLILIQIWRFFTILSAFDILALSGIVPLKGGNEVMFHLKFSSFT
jgi:hypothetical protein